MIDNNSSNIPFSDENMTHWVGAGKNSEDYACISINGSGLEVLEDISLAIVSIYRDMVNDSHIPPEKVAKVLSASVKATAEILEVDVSSLFSHAKHTAEDEDLLIGAWSHDGGIEVKMRRGKDADTQSKVLTAVTNIVDAVYKNLEKQYGPRFARYTLFKAWGLGTGELDAKAEAEKAKKAHEKTKGLLDDLAEKLGGIVLGGIADDADENGEG